MMNSFCQFILLILLLAQGSCTRPQVKKETALNAQDIKREWFKTRSIRLTNLNGEALTHLFYDPDPRLSLESMRVNFIPLAIAGSDKAYEIDVLSGQRFFSHFQCAQGDVWRERGTVSGSAAYTAGFIPRLFDQLNQPQRIIVFGGSRHYDLTVPEMYRVEIVGGFVEEHCIAGKCAGPKDWIGRIVLVGVDTLDPNYRQIKNFSQLRSFVNWDQVRGQLENLPGRNRIDADQYPALRVGNLLDARHSMDFLKKHSVTLTKTEIVSLQKSCGQLYDIFWNEAGATTLLDLPAKTPEEVKKRAKLYEELKKANKPTYFGQRLGSLLKKYGNDLATCARLVYPGDPNGDIQRFKFQMWVNQYVRMHKSGWEYDCRKQMWGTANVGAVAMQSIKDKAALCTAADYDKAMEFLPVALKNNRMFGDRWHFIAWDEHAHGSHAKLMSWVRLPERVFSCDEDMNEKVRATWSEWPLELEWARRYDERHLKDAGYIY